MSRRRLGFGIAALIGANLPIVAASGQQILLGSRRDPTVETAVEAISAERIEADVRKLASFGTRHTLSDQENPDRGIGAARRWLKAEFDKISAETGGRLVVTEHVFTQPAGGRVPEPTVVANLVAMLPGRTEAGRSRYLVVSGHYDSICRPQSDAQGDAPGANDDASGTAVVLELARAMAAHQFEATVVFLAVAGEEQGLLGSRQWAEEARAEGQDVEAMFTNDIVGNTLGGNGVRDATRVRVFSEGVRSAETEAEARARRSVGGENDAPSRQLARYIQGAAELYVAPFRVSHVFRRDRYGRGGDHIPFLENGYAAVRFTEPNEDFRRQHERVEVRDGVEYGDVPDRVDFDYVRQVARVNAAALASLAMAPGPPRGVRFAASRQAYDTTIAWDATDDPRVTGYRVVWRTTDQPVWASARDFPKAERATLVGLSKDDYFFAVQALDADGHASVPAFPQPGAGR